MRKILTGLVSAMAVAAMPAMAGTTGGEQSFDLLFKTGTLDDLPRDEIGRASCRERVCQYV